MPPLANVPGVVRVTWTGTLASVNVANTLHVKNTTTGSAWAQADATDLATFLRAAYVTRFIPDIADNFTLLNCEVVDLTSNLGVSATASGSTAGGIVTTSDLSSNVAACISWHTALRYRGGHPRMYLPPPSTAQLLNSNTWTSTFTAALNTAANGLLTDITGHALPSGGAIQAVMVSYIRAGVPLTTPLVNAITSATIDNRVDSQRRRLGPDR